MMSRAKLQVSIANAGWVFYSVYVFFSFKPAVNLGKDSRTVYKNKNYEYFV